jgi:hypothetical protein
MDKCSPLDQCLAIHACMVALTFVIYMIALVVLYYSSSSKLSIEELDGRCVNMSMSSRLLAASVPPYSPVCLPRPYAAWAAVPCEMSHVPRALVRVCVLLAVE